VERRREQRNRSFARKSDAITFDADMKGRRALGPVLAAELERESMTLDDYVRGPWRAHAATLAQPTRDKYAWALEKHLRELVDEPLLAIDAPMVASHQQRLLAGGATPTTVREVIGKLSGILQIATEHCYVPANAARAVRNVRTEGQVPVYYWLVRNVGYHSDLRAFIEGFEKTRQENRRLVAELGTSGPVDIELLRYDQFNRSVNDRLSLIGRYEILG
jgi:hypothetical protein